jgi:hypothetical protein
MTHDELVAVLNDYDIGLSNGMVHKDLVFATAKALRAVVELHKSIETTPPWGFDKYTACNVCEVGTNDGDYKLDYPCLTIQAIEKELG